MFPLFAKAAQMPRQTCGGAFVSPMSTFLPIVLRTKVIPGLEDRLEVHREVRLVPFGAPVEVRPSFELREPAVLHPKQSPVVLRLNREGEHRPMQIHPFPIPG